MTLSFLGKQFFCHEISIDARQMINVMIAQSLYLNWIKMIIPIILMLIVAQVFICAKKNPVDLNLVQGFCLWNCDSNKAFQYKNSC